MYIYIGFTNRMKNTRFGFIKYWPSVTVTANITYNNICTTILIIKEVYEMYCSRNTIGRYFLISVSILSFIY